MGAGSRGNLQEMLSTQASGQTSKTKILLTLLALDIDWKAFEAECKKIVNEVSEKFIDLGLEDHESDYGAGEVQAKQERFEREFNKIPFNFEAFSLQLPLGGASALQGA